MMSEEASSGQRPGLAVRSGAVVSRSVHRQVVGAVQATAAQSTHSHTPTNHITAHTHTHTDTLKGLEKEIELCMFYYFSPAVLKPGQSCNGVMYISLLS